MNKNTKKTGIRLAWLAITIIAIVLYLISFWYVKSEFEKASYALNSAEISYEQKDKIQTTAQNVEELEPQIEKINSYFVESDDVVGFINLLEQKAKGQGTSIETTDVSIEEALGDLLYGEVLKISLTVKGSWNNVMQYLNLVESLPYDIWITNTNLALKRNTDSENDNLYHWEADLTLLVLKHN